MKLFAVGYYSRNCNEITLNIVMPLQTCFQLIHYCVTIRQSTNTFNLLNHVLLIFFTFNTNNNYEYYLSVMK